MDSCETGDVRVWFAERGWFYHLLGLLKLPLAEFCSLTGEGQNVWEVGKLVVTPRQKHIRKLRIHFASTCGNCINPAPKHILYHLHLVEFDCWTKFWRIREGWKQKAASSVCSQKSKFSTTGVWIRLFKTQGHPSTNFSAFEVKCFWNTDVRDCPIKYK